MSTKKLAIFSIVFLVLLAGGAFSISLILENFDTLSVEGIQFEKTAGYVRLERNGFGLSRRGIPLWLEI